MIRPEEVRPFVWPTEEPEIPPKLPPPARSEGSEAPGAPAGAGPGTPRQPTPAHPAASGSGLPAGIEQDSTHAYVWQNAAAAAAVVRTMIHGPEEVPTEGPLAGMSARREVAALMASLGVPVGIEVLRNLSKDDAAWVGTAVAEEPETKHGVAMHALEMLRQRMVAGDYLECGGRELARALLARVFGGSRARLMVHGDDERSGFEILKDVAPEQVAPFVSHEHPQTIALVLSQLDRAQAAGILAQLPERMQSDVAFRMATMENITPEVLLEIGEALEASLQDILAGNRDVGGPKVVADIINLTGSSVEKNVLDQMDAQDPEVAEAVRNLMFTYADIDRMSDREIQVLIGECDRIHWVMALKATGDGMRARILRLMPEETRTFVTAELDKGEPIRLSEAEDIQLRIVQQARQLEEQGKVMIVRGDSGNDWV